MVYIFIMKLFHFKHNNNRYIYILTLRELKNIIIIEMKQKKNNNKVESNQQVNIVNESER